jgi:hypothetical protein
MQQIATEENKNVEIPYHISPRNSCILFITFLSLIIMEISENAQPHFPFEI